MHSNTAEDAVVILLYHGVTAAESQGIENFSGKHIAAEEFDRQMRFLAENAVPLPLRYLSDLVAAGETPPPGSVAVTFDDSFRNIHESALPILSLHGIPATFFVSTGFVGTNRRFWVDVVEHAINRAEARTLRIRLEDVEREFDVCTHGGRIEAVTEIKAVTKRMNPAQRAEILAALIEETGVDDSGDEVPNYANLNWDDIRALDEGVGYDVGGHTVNHEILAHLDDKQLEFEISGCLRDLEVQLGHSVDLFSYPEGQADHFDERVISRLKAHGVRICPTAIGGINPPGTDPFHLRRIMVGFMGESFPRHYFSAAAQ